MDTIAIETRGEWIRLVHAINASPRRPPNESYGAPRFVSHLFLMKFEFLINLSDKKN